MTIFRASIPKKIPWTTKPPHGTRLNKSSPYFRGLFQDFPFNQGHGWSMEHEVGAQFKISWKTSTANWDVVNGESGITVPASGGKDGVRFYSPATKPDTVTFGLKMTYITELANQGVLFQMGGYDFGNDNGIQLRMAAASSHLFAMMGGAWNNVSSAELVPGNSYVVFCTFDLNSGDIAYFVDGEPNGTTTIADVTIGWEEEASLGHQWQYNGNSENICMHWSAIWVDRILTLKEMREFSIEKLYEPQIRQIPVSLIGPTLASGTPSIDSPTASGVAEIIVKASGTPSVVEPSAAGVADLVTALESSGTPSIVEPSAAGVVSITPTLASSGTPSIDLLIAVGVAVRKGLAITDVNTDETWTDGDAVIPITGKGFV